MIIKKRGRMKHLFSSKKAVSPLIATVLLIAFAIALGAVVMNWGRGYIEAEAVEDETIAEGETDPCAADISLKLLMLGDKKDLCFDGTSIKYGLENSGQVKIKNIKVQIVGDQVFEKVQPGMDIAGISKQSVPYDKTTYGEPQLVRFIPQINGQLCAKKAAQETTVAMC